jgi:hypothetical protein
VPLDDVVKFRPFVGARCTVCCHMHFEVRIVLLHRLMGQDFVHSESIVGSGSGEHGSGDEGLKILYSLCPIILDVTSSDLNKFEL